MQLNLLRSMRTRGRAADMAARNLLRVFLAATVLFPMGPVPTMLFCLYSHNSTVHHNESWGGSPKARAQLNPLVAQVIKRRVRVLLPRAHEEIEYSTCLR